MRDHLKTLLGIMITAAPAWVILLGAGCERQPDSLTYTAQQLREASTADRDQRVNDVLRDILAKCRVVASMGGDGYYVREQLPVSPEEIQLVLEQLRQRGFTVSEGVLYWHVSWERPKTAEQE